MPERSIRKKLNLSDEVNVDKSPITAKVDCQGGETVEYRVYDVSVIPGYEDRVFEIPDTVLELEDRDFRNAGIKQITALSPNQEVNVTEGLLDVLDQGCTQVGCNNGQNCLKKRLQNR